MELSLKLAGETKLFLIFEQKDFWKKNTKTVIA